MICKAKLKEFHFADFSLLSNDKESSKMVSGVLRKQKDPSNYGHDSIWNHKVRTRSMLLNSR